MDRKTTIYDVEGYKVEVNDYLIGGEKQEFIRLISKTQDITKISNEIIDATSFAMQKILVSIDGIKEDVYNKMLSLDTNVYDWLITKTSEITAGKKKI